MHIDISLKEQRLTLFDVSRKPLLSCAISSAANGPGCQKNSGCTPLGQHAVRAKIGAGAPVNSVFVGRRATGELCTPDLMAAFPERDWILTRILWLSGTELGINRLGEVDTMQRYIYIHGTPDSVEMGKIGSHGCIRMRNAELIRLFDLVAAGTTVNIRND
jgi:lipoprotein-anchoring transpeptidase ErfK/SrfK